MTNSLLDVLSDVAPKTVPFRGKEIPVYGVSVVGVAILMRRFKEVRAMLSGRDLDLSAETIFDLGPNVVRTVIALGFMKPDADGEIDAETLAKTEHAVSAVPLHDQLDLLRAVVDATFPRGPKGFFDELGAMMGQAESLIPQQ